MNKDLLKAEIYFKYACGYFSEIEKNYLIDRIDQK